MNLRYTIAMLSIVACLWSSGAYSQAPPEDEHAHHHHPPAAETEEAAGLSEREHVAPAAPAHETETMSYRQMVEMMQMDDTAKFGKVLIDQLEWRDTQGANAAMWAAQAWYGNDYNKLWLKSEGERRASITEDARIEALWDHIFARWWSAQVGMREDLGHGPSRTWAAAGVQGLAPYRFDVEATLYVGGSARTAARFKAEHDLLITQRLVLQPEAEINLYGKDDVERRIGAGLSDVDVGLRLRYEFRREFAPYVGLTWTRRFGKTADLVRAAGEDANDLQVLAGLRVWF